MCERISTHSPKRGNSNSLVSFTVLVVNCFSNRLSAPESFIHSFIHSCIHSFLHSLFIPSVCQALCKEIDFVLLQVCFIYFNFWPHPSACGITVPHQSLNPNPLHQKWGRVSTLGPPGKSPRVCPASYFRSPALALPFQFSLLLSAFGGTPAGRMYPGK